MPGVRPAGGLREYRRDGDGLTLKYDVRFSGPGQVFTVSITETLRPFADVSDAKRTGFERILHAENVPRGFELLLAAHHSDSALGGATIRREKDEAAWQPLATSKEPLPHGVQRRATIFPHAADGKPSALTLRYEAALTPKRLTLPQKPVSIASSEAVTVVPGYEGRRLPLDTSIMPTGIAWTKSGTLAFTSLKGHVGLLKDTDGDGFEDTLTTFEEGLAAPYGLVADGDDLLVAHKPEVLRLRDTDGDGRADLRSVFAAGWGYSDNYHDWTCGFAHDAAGNLFVGLGSDYAQADRKKETALWRGKVLRISPQGSVTPIAHAFRYPTGLAIDGKGRLFVTDNQGVQNTFNELNRVVEGKSYGVPSRFEEQPDARETPPAIQIPHPWTRSVNGIAFLLPAPVGAKRPADDHPAVAYAGHGIGCDYDTRALVRFTIQQVDEVVQGAVYPFSLNSESAPGESPPKTGGQRPPGSSGFTGPLSIGVSPAGDLFIGSIHDSGWLGGLNTGDIVRLRPAGALPNGIVEMRAVPKGFEITFLRPIDPVRGGEAGRYTLSGYTRRWKGAYATPDSGRHTADIDSVVLSSDGRRATLAVDDLKEGYVYELHVGQVTDGDAPLFPAAAHYTLHRRPRASVPRQ